MKALNARRGRGDLYNSAQMPAIFRKKGVKPQVLQVIEGQAQQEKTRLLADFTDDAGDDGQEARPDSGR